MVAGGSLTFCGCENIHSVLLLVEEMMVQIQWQQWGWQAGKGLEKLCKKIRASCLANNCPKEGGRSPRELQGFGYGQLRNSESITETGKSGEKLILGERYWTRRV